MVATSNFVDVSGAILASLLFFMVVFVSQKTGFIPEVKDRIEIGTGKLVRMDLSHGRPSYFEVALNGGGTVTGGTSTTDLPSGFREIASRIFDGSGPRVILEVDKRIEVSRAGPNGPAVSVSRYEIAEVVHFDFVPEGVTPTTDYDQRKLPRYLFIGAAGMVLLSLAWLWKPIRQVRIEELQGHP